VNVTTPANSLATWTVYIKILEKIEGVLGDRAS